MDISVDYIRQMSETNTFQLNSLQPETLVIGLQDKFMKIMNRIISTPIDVRNIRGNHISRIDTPGMTKNVWGILDTTSNVLSEANNVYKLDTHVQRSTTQDFRSSNL